MEYPTACSPLAWASGAPLLLLRAMLGLEPVGDNLLVDPAILKELGQLELLDIQDVGEASTPSAVGGWIHQ